MDDLRLIRETLEGPPPSAQATFQARSQLTTAIARWQSTPQRRVRGLRWSLSGAAVLAGIATVVAVGGIPGQQEPTPPAARQPAVLSAQDLLLAAAEGASTASTGTYWRVQRVGRAGPYQVGAESNRYDVLGRSVTENWIARKPGEASWVGYRDLGFRPRGESDRQAWRKAGSPKYWDVEADTTEGSRRLTTAPGRADLRRDDAAANYLQDLGGFDFAEVQQLPTDPATLRALIVKRIAADPEGFLPGTWGSNARLFGTLNQLLLDVPAPPRLRAAAFRVLADIPGVRGTGEVKDAEGRTGVGVELTRTSGGVAESHRLILDRTTHVIMARDYVARWTDKPKEARPVKEQHVVILRAEWTDRKPEPPTVD
jgi:hypothetical protein